MMEGTIWLRANRRIDFTIVISDSSTYFRAIFILSFFFHLPGKKKILNVNRINEITIMTNISWNEKVLNYNSLFYILYLSYATTSQDHYSISSIYNRYVSLAEPTLNLFRFFRSNFISN